MRLLFFTDGGHGVGPFFIEQIKAIHKQHKEVYAIVSSKEIEPHLIEDLEINKIPLLLLKGLENHKNIHEHIDSLKKYIIKNNINIIHVQTNWQLILITIVKFKLLFKHKFKIIYTIHAFRNNLHSAKAFFAKLAIGTILFLFANRIICTCNYVKRNFILLNYKIKIIPLGVSKSFFQNYTECTENCLKIIFPGSFRVGKNQDLVIKAFNEYINDSNDIDSMVCLPGDGQLLEKMILLTKELGIEKRVIFPGQCNMEQIKEYYKQSNICVIPTNSETFGLCITEPFVMGRCIITRHVGVADDIIKENINGYFFNNENELKQLFLDTAKNKNILNKIGERNFKLRDRFNWDNITQDYLYFLNNI